MTRIVRSGLLAAGLALVVGAGGGGGACRAGVAAPATVTAAFNRDCEALLVEEVSKATNELLVAAFSITRPSIVAALAEAARKGVRVRVKYDAKQADYEPMQAAIAALRQAQVKCSAIRMPGEYLSMHNKFVVLDRERVLTGSYNYTNPASEQNYENIVLIQSPVIAVEFAKRFDALRSRN